MGQGPPVGGYGGSSVGAAESSSASEYKSSHEQSHTSNGNVTTHMLSNHAEKKQPLINSIRPPFSQAILNDIYSPQQAAKLLGFETTRQITRAYRRAILACIPHSNYHSYSGTQQDGEDYDSYTSDDEHQYLESEEESCDLDNVMKLFFPEKNKDSSSSIPPCTTQKWLSRQYGIDKHSFSGLVLPPHSHTPLGVMDCIFIALSTLPQNLQNSPANKQNHNSQASLVRLPDLVIFFAVFLHGTVEKKTTLAFRVYDSYSKKNTLTRDTLSRFISAVYENSGCLETPYTKKMLDTMMDAYNGKEQPSSLSSMMIMSKPKLQPGVPKAELRELTLEQFLKAIELTTSSSVKDFPVSFASYSDKSDVERIDQLGKTHLLIVWLETFCRSIMPKQHQRNPALEYPYSSPKDVKRKLSSASSNSYLKGLYRTHKFTRTMQFECKRKFRSVCTLADNVIQEQKLTTAISLEVGTDDNGNQKSLESKEGQSIDKPQQNNHHSIQMRAFFAAVSDPIPEMGWGGFLPQSMARMLFLAGCQNSLTQTNDEWTLSDAVSFACIALRKESERDLFKFCFEMFTRFHGSSSDTKTKMENDPDNEELNSTLNPDDLSDQSNYELDRHGVGKMILDLLDHFSYRQLRDTPMQGSAKVSSELDDWKSWWYHTDRDSGNTQNERNNVSEKNIIFVDTGAATSLGLISKNDHGFNSNAVFLDALVDTVFDHVNENETISFEGFIKWSYETSVLRYLILDMKLIAGVVFGVRPYSPVQESVLVEEIRRRFDSLHPVSPSMRRGPIRTVWYILSTTWWKKWSEYTSSAVRYIEGTGTLSPPPGAIDNNALLLQGSLALRRNIIFKTHFELIPPLAWQALQAWHDGGPPIHRRVQKNVISQTRTPSNAKKHTPRTEIELYPIFLTISLVDSNTGQPRPFQQCVPVSHFEPAYIIVEELCKSLQYQKDNIMEYARLWKVGDRDEDMFLLDLQVSLKEQNVHQMEGDRGTISLMLELKKEDGDWPKGDYGDDNVSPEPSDVAESSNTHLGDGVVGLYNMGNTCYLNSSIQCLSHTPLLRQYFTSKAYLKDINTTNIFGHQGRLAQVSAVLINELWRPTNPHKITRLSGIRPNTDKHIPCPSLTPKSFKDAIGKFNDHFAGNEQHDAQELLSYLLGGLSEDLNLIESKPYIEQPDSDGRPNKELADIWWRNHLRREMSIIVALFTGQYKSLLTCKACRYESARFEPFMYLQVPLPEDNLINVHVVFIPITESKKILKYSVRVKHDGNLKDVLIGLSRILYLEEKDELNEKNKTAKNGEVNGENYVQTDGSKPASQCNAEEEEKEEDSKENMENKYIIALAEGMAVIELRDCYIKSIVPTHRTLSDIQSRDGEMPLIFVHQLEPLCESVEVASTTINQKNEDAPTQNTIMPDSSNESCVPKRSDVIQEAKEISSNTNDRSHTSKKTQTSSVLPPPTKKENSPDVNSSVILPRPRQSFIAVAQRKVEPVSNPLLHSSYLQCVDTPLLLRIYDLEGFTGKDVYDLVANHISRYFPGGSISDLLRKRDCDVDCMETTDNIPEADDSKKVYKSTENQSSLKSKRRHKVQPTRLDMLSDPMGQKGRYGFQLRITIRDCTRCSRCPWYNCCIGCVVPDDDYPTIVQDGDSISLDWHIDVYGAIFENKDAPEKSGTIARGQTHFEMGEHIPKHPTCKDDNFNDGRISLEECLDAFAKEEKIPEAYCSKCKDFRVSTKCMSLWRLPPVMIIHLKRFQFTQHMRRKLRNLVIFPLEGLDFSGIVASDSSRDDAVDIMNEVNNVCMDENGEVEKGVEPRDDENENYDDVNGINGDPVVNENGKAKSTDDTKDPSELLYDLYGIIHHHGALSTGHYMASIRSETDGKWRLFNDDKVYEVEGKALVDNMAYILFYVRKDMKTADLSDFWDTSSRGGSGLTEDQIDKLTKQRERCVVS